MFNRNFIFLKLPFAIAIILFQISFAIAHQSDLSSVILSKTANGKIILQITSSLTAFQHELNFIHGEGSYHSPEEFQKLVIDHFTRSFSIVLNEKDTLTFLHPTVIIGHETKLISEVIGLPKEVTSIHLENHVFKDIQNNQSVLLFILHGFPENEKFVLNKDNSQELRLALKDGDWLVQKKGDSNLIAIIALPSALLLGLVAYFIQRSRKKMEVDA